MTPALVLALVLGSVCHAARTGKVSEDDISDIQNQIDDQKNEIDETQQKIDETEARQKALEDAKAEMEAYLADLNDQYDSLSEEIEALNQQIEDKQSEIEEAQEELEEAKTRMEEQYADMKTRIQYMYENPNSSFLELLVEAGSFAAALNRTDYASSITAYDRDMLNAYTAAKEEVEQQEAALEGEKEALEDLQKEASARQEEVSALASSTTGKISEQVKNIADAQAELEGQNDTLEYQQDVLNQLIAEKKLIEAQLEAQKAAEIAASLGDVTGVQNSGTDYAQNGGYSATEEEVTALAVLIYCEAGNQGYEGQLAVGSVVMNRIRDSRFAQTTIMGVIRASGQFSPVTSGRFDLMLESGLSQVTDSCYAAARAAIGGTSNVGNRTFFRTWSGHPELSGLVIGAHIFSYTWNYADAATSAE